MPLRAELIKASTTRQLLWSIVGAAVTVAVGVVSMILSQPTSVLEQGLHEQQFYLWTSMVTATFALILGSRIVTDEYRHGSIVPAVVASPRRGGLVTAKVLVGAGVGSLIAVISHAAMVGVAVVGAGQKGAVLVVSTEDIGAMSAMVMTAAGWGVLGVGLGLLVRHQVAAAVGALLWMLAVENLASGAIGSAARFLPGRAGHALGSATAAGDLLTPVAAGLALLAWVGVFAVAGWARFARSDVEPV